MNQHIKILEQINNKSFNPNFEDLDQLLSYMLNNIGHTDSYIRDTLIYSGFCELILNNYLTDSQLILIAKTCCDIFCVRLSRWREQQYARYVRRASYFPSQLAP